MTSKSWLRQIQYIRDHSKDYDYDHGLKFESDPIQTLKKITRDHKSKNVYVLNV